MLQSVARSTGLNRQASSVLGGLFGSLFGKGGEPVETCSSPSFPKLSDSKRDNKMFCFQCQETKSNVGCTVRGMCGKMSSTANLQDRLVQLCKEIAIAYEKSPGDIKEVGFFIVQSLFITITNGNFDDVAIQAQIDKAIQIRDSLYKGVPQAPLGVVSVEDPDIRSLREIITYGIKGFAAYAEHAAALGKEDDDIYRFCIKGLAKTTQDLSVDELVGLALETGTYAVKTMALLDEANTSTYGNPEITKVNIGVGNRPGILVSGHDLRDIYELLEQTKDSGIDIYTHGEMLPAHYYPEIKKYPHLFGNYGNAWWQQNTEFDKFNGPILMTTNCIIPLNPRYKNRIFTTGIVGYPGVPHIPNRKDGKPKDFSKLIEIAKNCPPPVELEKGEIVGGFAHAQVFALADKIVDAVKSGAIKHFVVMGGCDGRNQDRQYFTDMAKALPKDAVILTCGCAKFRYNKLDLGDIGGIPRVLDAGQCNDSYSLAIIALKLKEIFELDDVNKLPLSFDIGWYEQKAVTVLLALLSLGFKNVRIGPTLPAFISPNVLDLLVKTFGVQISTTVADDLPKILRNE